MHIAVYILIQALAIVFFLLTFYKKTPLVSIIAMLFSSILVVGGWFINVGIKYVWDPSIRAYAEESIIMHTPYIPALNMAIFGLALVFVFFDILEIVRGQARGTGNIDASTLMDGKKGEKF